MAGITDEKLLRRLKRMGVTKGLRVKPKPAPPAPAGPEVGPEARVEATLPGELLHTAHGPVWVERRTYPATCAHGHYCLGDVAQVSAEALALMGVPELGERPAFLDTETTGLAGGAGTLVFLTGVGVWEADRLDLHLVFLRDPAEEPAAMRYIEDVLRRATGIVSFNGASFDLPLLETRFILSRLDPRWLALPHLDLLTVARQLWRDHLPSRALGALEAEILQVARSGADTPSWLIPSLYQAYLRDGDEAPMAGIFYHNRVDVLSLVVLLAHIARVATAPETMALASGEWVGVGRLYDGIGREADALDAWGRALADGGESLAEDCAARIWREVGVRHKRREAWSEAFAAWDAWARAQPLAVEPLVERAKYYEWTTKDLEAALEETAAALRRAQAHPAGPRREQTLAELRHRHARLERKLQR